MSTKKKAVRAEFNRVCLERDGDKCRTCRNIATEVHHVLDKRFLPDELKYVEENGISLCNPCHQKAEEFHINEGKSWIEGYHPNDLYALISSPWRTKMWESIRTSYYD